MKKTSIFLIALLLASVVFAEDIPLDLFDFTGGLMDRVSADRMPLKYTPDSRNVVFDEDMGLVMRPEYIKFNPTALEGSKSILSLYNYKKVDGTDYLVVQSSRSLFFTKDQTTYTKLTSTFTVDKRMTYDTALDTLWGGNGTDREWKSTGASITMFTTLNSTNMVRAKYHCWNDNRMFRAGVTGYPLTLYYSEIRTLADGTPAPDPADLGAGTNWDYIPQNGESITALGKLNGYLYIFTENSTWKKIGTDPTSWRYICINPFIGCLYNSSLDYLNGNMVFMSARGMEEFDGDSFKPLTEPIDNQIKALTQLNVNQSALTQDSAANWGQGTCVNVSTTSNPGSVGAESGETEYNESGLYGSSIDLYDKKVRQSFQTTTPRIYDTIKLYFFGTSPSSPNNKLDVHILDKNYSTLASSVGFNIGAWSGIESRYITVKLNNTANILANTTYYFLVSSHTLADNKVWLNDDLGNSYLRGTPQTAIYGNNWLSVENDNVFYIMASTTIPFIFTSQTLNAGTSWGSWGTYSDNTTIPTGSNIYRYLRAGGKTPVPVTQPLIPVTNGTAISLSTGPYIAQVSSYTRTVASAAPLLNEFSITYSGVNNSIPVIKTYRDSPYVGVLKDSTINNLVYRFNRNRIFELYDNMYPGCFATYRGDLLMGSSQDTGQIYKMNIGSNYEDAIGTYTAYYFTPNIDCGLPLNDKIFKSLWVTSSKDTVDFDISYTINGSTNTYYLNPSFVSNKINTQRLNLDSAYRVGKNIQFKIYSTEYFNIRGMVLYYEKMPLR